MSIESKLVVHVVHGTWPFGLFAHFFGRRPTISREGKPVWFYQGSDFQQAIASEVQGPLEWVSFDWSGGNSFAARHTAAVELCGHLKRWFEKCPEARHVIIAHSHGGTVAVRAASMLDIDDVRGLSSIISLASPFAKVYPSRRPDAELAGRYVALKYGWVSIFVAVGLSFHPDLSITLAMFFGIYGFSLIFLLWMALSSIKVIPNAPEYAAEYQVKDQKWKLMAIRAAGDEAGLSIGAAQFVALVSDVLFRPIRLIPIRLITAVSMKFSSMNMVKSAMKLGSIGTLMGIVIVFFNLSDRGLLTWSYFFENAGSVALSIVVYSISGFIGLVVTIAGIFVNILILSLGIIFFLGAIVLLPSIMLLSLSLGKEVYGFYGLLDVACEPSPSGVNCELTMVDIPTDERSGMLHSIYSYTPIRQKIGKLLKVT